MEGGREIEYESLKNEIRQKEFAELLIMLEKEKENINRLNFRKLNYISKLIRLKIPEKIEFKDYFPLLHILEVFIDLGKRRVDQSKSILKKARSTKRELVEYFHHGIMPRLRENLYKNLDSFYEIIPFVKEVVKRKRFYNLFYRRLLYNDKRILDIRQPRAQILKLQNRNIKKHQIKELLIANFKKCSPSQKLSELKSFLYQIKEGFVYKIGRASCRERVF